MNGLNNHCNGALEKKRTVSTARHGCAFINNYKHFFEYFNVCWIKAFKVFRTKVVDKVVEFVLIREKPYRQIYILLSLFFEVLFIYLNSHLDLRNSDLTLQINYRYVDYTQQLHRLSTRHSKYFIQFVTNVVMINSNVRLCYKSCCW